jgi:hypothetical protein
MSGPPSAGAHPSSTSHAAQRRRTTQLRLSILEHFME